MAGSDAICEELPWDSSFFGVSIARARASTLDDRACDAMLEWCRVRRTDCLYFLCPLDEAATQRVLTDAGFQLVGVKVTLSRSAQAGAGELRGRTRPATSDDIAGLRQIALTAYRDTRFHADGHFDPARCDELYATWIENSVRGYADHVLVAERDDTVVGFITVHVDAPDARRAGDRTARIGLVGVDERWRNQGVGRDLLRRTGQIVTEQGVGKTSVATPGRNVAALKLYKSEGFRTTEVSLWYHRWFRDGRR